MDVAQGKRVLGNFERDETALRNYASPSRVFGHGQVPANVSNLQVAIVSRAPGPSTMASTSVSGQSKPSIRRKSSAQNILSTFRSASSSNPPQTATGLTMQIPSGALNSGMNGYIGSATPITSTPMSREWDAQSLAGDSMNSNQPLTAGANGTPTLTQGTTAESLRDLVMKRMITLTYLRNVHEG